MPGGAGGQPATVAQLQARLEPAGAAARGPVRRAQPDAGDGRAGGAAGRWSPARCRTCRSRPCADPGGRCRRTSRPARSRCPARGRHARPRTRRRWPRRATSPAWRRRSTRRRAPRPSDERLGVLGRLAAGPRHAHLAEPGRPTRRPSSPPRGSTAGSRVERLLGEDGDDEELRRRGERGRPAAARDRRRHGGRAARPGRAAGERPGPARRRRRTAAAVEADVTALTLWVLRGGDPAAGRRRAEPAGRGAAAGGARADAGPAGRARRRRDARRGVRDLRPGGAPASRCCRRCPATTSTTSSSARSPGCCGCAPAASRPTWRSRR